jgi:glycosyltransferase involved in cell wall biosynthesis
VESVLRQKTGQIEYIVIDGESSDGTREILKEYQSHIDRIVSEADTGIYSAINKGIRYCSGSLIGLMHAGDRYLDGVLRDVIEQHEVDPSSIIYGAMKWVRDGRFEQIWGPNHETLVRAMIPHLSSFVPMSVYVEQGLYDESYKIAADYEAFLRFYTHGIPFRFIDRIVCEFDLGGISSRSPIVGEETFRIRERYGVLTDEEKLAKRRVKPILKALWRRLIG